MLSSKKLIEAGNSSYEENKDSLPSDIDYVYKNGFYNGYLFSERNSKPQVLSQGELMVIVGDTKKRKPKVKTSTGKLATVGIGRKNANK